jgi:NAD(P)-dependent dehydrogenase (short-subunit alcohol dehydrogenase family)
MSTTDLFSLDGRAAVVTGGTSGIGRMIADGLIDAGVRTYIASRKADACARVAAELSERGTCVGIAADLSTEAGCRDLAAEIAEREDRIHLLVNNAGATWGAPLEEYPDAAFDKVFAINVKGVFHLTRALLPQLRAAASEGTPPGS